MIQMMRPLILILALATPLGAQTASDWQEGWGKLQEGGRDILRGFGNQLDRFGQGLAELDPWWQQLQGLLEDFDHYETPERLPNGDILIRRKPEAPPLEDPFIDL